MVSKRKLWVTTLSSLIIIVGALLGFLYWYGNQSDIPNGLRLYNWNMGGITREQWKEEWKTKIEALQTKQIAIQYKGDTRTHSIKELGGTTNADMLYQQILSYGNHGSFLAKAWERWEARSGIQYKLTLNWPKDVIKEKLEKDWKNINMPKPINAKRIIQPNEAIIYQPDQPGKSPNFVKLTGTIANITGDQLWNQASFSLPLPLKEEKASVTLQDLKNQGIAKKIAEFTTHYAPDSGGRTYNVEITAQVLNNTILKPGEIFDYRKVIQGIETKYGYKPAPEIVNGQLQQGIGGGICQVSSTLYNVVLFSNLEVIERHNHSLPVSYVPLGRDATYDDNGPNFRFKNTTQKSLLIYTDAKDGQLTIKFFGTPVGNQQIELFSETVANLSSPVEITKDPSLPNGQRRIIHAGRDGFKVNVYKTIKQNGQIVKKTLLSQDTYRAQPTLIVVGTGKTS